MSSGVYFFPGIMSRVSALSGGPRTWRRSCDDRRAVWVFGASQRSGSDYWHKQPQADPPAMPRQIWRHLKREPFCLVEAIPVVEVLTEDGKLRGERHGEARRAVQCVVAIS